MKKNNKMAIKSCVKANCSYLIPKKINENLQIRILIYFLIKVGLAFDIHTAVNSQKNKSNDH